MDVLNYSMVAILSQCLHIVNHHVVLFKYIMILFAITPQ